MNIKKYQSLLKNTLRSNIKQFNLDIDVLNDTKNVIKTETDVLLNITNIQELSFNINGLYSFIYNVKIIYKNEFRHLYGSFKEDFDNIKIIITNVSLNKQILKYKNKYENEYLFLNMVQVDFKNYENLISQFLTLYYKNKSNLKILCDFILYNIIFKFDKFYIGLNVSNFDIKYTK